MVVVVVVVIAAVVIVVVLVVRVAVVAQAIDIPWGWRVWTFELRAEL